MVAWARLSLPSPHRPRQGILQSDWTPVSIFITCMQTGLLLVHFKSQNLQRGATCLRWRWLHCWFNWQTAVCPPLQESVWQTRRWNTGRIPSTTSLRFYCVGLYIHRVCFILKGTIWSTHFQSGIRGVCADHMYYVLDDWNANAVIWVCLHCCRLGLEIYTHVVLFL